MHFSIFLQWHFKILKLAVLCILVYFCSGCRIKKLSDQSQMFTAPLTNILPCANTCCVSHCSCRCRQEVGHIVAVCHIAVADVVKKWAILSLCVTLQLPMSSRSGLSYCRLIYQYFPARVSATFVGQQKLAKFCWSCVIAITITFTQSPHQIMQT